MKLFVKVTNAGVEPMTLSVKPSYSIEMIKTQIQSLKDIPVNNQTLKLNGIELKNKDNLSQNQIENCIIWLSYKPKEISIHIFENWRIKKETISIEVDWTEKILQIKCEVFKKKRIPNAWQEIYLGIGVWTEENKLEYYETLDDDKVSKKAVTEGLSLMISGFIQIHNVESVESNNFNVDFEGFETITEVKKKIQVYQQFKEFQNKKRSKFFESNTESILYKRDEYEILQRLEDDDKTVYDYGIDDFIKGKFILTKTPDHEPKNYPIIVKIPDVGEIKIDCYHFDTISTLKRRIRENGKFRLRYRNRNDEIAGLIFPPFELIFSGQPLQELERTLKDYKIVRNSFVECIIDAEKPIANVKTVTAQESLKCDKCEKTFFWPAELKLHIDSQHYQQASSSENEDLILGY